MAYQEKDFQTEFNKWLKIVFRGTGAFELKLSKTNSIPFSDVKQHQKDALFHAKHGTLAYKIPDDTYSQKPFDCFVLTEVHACVAIMFNGKGKNFYLIDVDAWIAEERLSARRSLTETRAAEIGSKYDLSGTLPYTQGRQRKV